MKHLFVPYNLAIQLKEKGYDVKGLAAYSADGRLFIEKEDTYPNRNTEAPEDWGQSTAPLYQQVVDWFETKNLHVETHYLPDTKEWKTNVYNMAYDELSYGAIYISGEICKSRYESIDATIKIALNVIK